MANSFAFIIRVTQETKCKSGVSFKLDITLAKCKELGSFGIDYFAANSVKAHLAQHHVFVLCLRMVTCCRDRNLKPF